MAGIRANLAALPLVPRYVAIGMTSAFVVGGLVGLVLGLLAYPPTAGFAVLEIGVPAAILGSVIGALVGATTLAVRRARG